MIRIALATTIAAALIIATVPAHADDPFIAEQKPTEYLAKDRLIGAKVKDSNGKIIGDIEDLIVGGENQVVGVIMGVGGLLGLGEKKVAIVKSALSLEVTDGKMNVVMPSATKETLAAAPSYKRINPPKGWFQRAVEKGQELKDKGEVTAKDAYEAAKEKSGPALEKAKDAAKGVIERAKEAAHPEAAQPDAAQPDAAPKN